MASNHESQATHPPRPPRSPRARKQKASGSELLLDFMKDFAAVVASHEDLRPILDWVVESVKQVMGCDEACVRLLGPDGQASDAADLAWALRDRGTTIAFRRDRGATSWPEHAAKAVMGYVLGGDQPLETRDLAGDKRFPELNGNSGTVRAALVVPLKAENRPIGILAATETEPGRGWSDGERNLLSALACNTGFALERARLRSYRGKVEELTRWKQERLREHSFAAHLQRNLLPPTPLHLGGWEVAGMLRPTHQVGGDGFDLRRLDDHRLRFSLLDVAGKGMSAAIVMVTVQMLLREVCSSTGCMRDLMRRIDRALAEMHTDCMVTMFYAELDTATGRLRYHRAGHTYPFLRRRTGTIEDLTKGGFPLGLGMIGEVRIEETQIEPGDALLVYSDGATDVMNTDLELFGEDGLRALWRSVGSLDPARALEAVMQELRSYQGNMMQADDITLLGLAARKGGPNRGKSGGGP